VADLKPPGAISGPSLDSDARWNALVSGVLCSCAAGGLRRSSIFNFRLSLNGDFHMLPKLMFAALFAAALTAGSVLAAEKAVKPAAKEGDCCAQKLACCEKQNACCTAEKKPGCCEKGMKCCAENRACCGPNPPECCVKGEACCDGPNDCCGEAGKTVAKKDGKKSDTKVAKKTDRKAAACCAVQVAAKSADKPACCASVK